MPDTACQLDLAALELERLFDAMARHDWDEVYDVIYDHLFRDGKPSSEMLAEVMRKAKRATEGAAR